MVSIKTSSSSWLYNAKIRSYIFQAIVLLGLIFSLMWFVDNTLTNLQAQGKNLGFGFLDQNAGFQIGKTLGTYLLGYTVGNSSYLDVYYIGIINTFLVAALGIIIATILGFVIGIMRLSSNLVINGFATIYVEVLRNVPLLLQLFFWYFAVLRGLPDRRNKIDLAGEYAGINITGLYLPAPLPQAGFSIVAAVFGLALFGWYMLSKWSQNRQMNTGQTFPVFWTGIGIVFVGTALAYFITGKPLDWSLPVFKDTGAMLRRGFQSGQGMVLIPEFIAILLALALYTAAFIAEIVRAGIIAIAKGQTEASYSLGLRPGVTLRLIIIPQALRIIIPPLTSQYLNLTKNSSLAVAIAYPELVSIFAGTALNQVGKEIEMIFMMMSVYLTFSIVTSIFMNWFNARVKLVER